MKYWLHYNAPQSTVPLVRSLFLVLIMRVIGLHSVRTLPLEGLIIQRLPLVSVQIGVEGQWNHVVRHKHHVADVSNDHTYKTERTTHARVISMTKT